MSLDRTELEERLSFALDASRQAGELILGYYQAAGLTVEQKTDQSPVTAADRGAEKLLRHLIGETFPDDGIVGEEFDDKPSSNGFRWILDPIDGTKSFVHGVPLFGTLIGLVSEPGRCVLGVSRLPALDEVVYAAEGTGTWWQIGSDSPRRTQVTSVSRLSDALLCFTEIEGWAEIGRKYLFDRLCASVRMTRGWGDCYGHVLVATGRADLMIDPIMSVWDAAALVPILQEAGGHFLDWTGRPTFDGGNGVSVNFALRDDVLQILTPD